MTRIAGLLMAHNSPYIKMTLDSMSEFCNDGILVNCNEIEFASRKVVNRHPAVRDVIFTKNGYSGWKQGHQRDLTMRMLDRIEPDIVLWPDDDETYYNGFNEDLNEFIGNRDLLTFWIRLLYLWGDKDHFRNDGMYRKVHKVTALKWRSGLTYNPYAGYTCPREFINMPKSTRFHGKKPLPHWGYMTGDSQDKKIPKKKQSSITRKEPLVLEVPKDIV